MQLSGEAGENTGHSIRTDGEHVFEYVTPELLPV